MNAPKVLIQPRKGYRTSQGRTRLHFSRTQPGDKAVCGANARILGIDEEHGAGQPVDREAVCRNCLKAIRAWQDYPPRRSPFLAAKRVEAEAACRWGDWVATFSGKRFYPMNPLPGDFCLEDIAHSLSLSCRFGGHARHMWSVAQHSLIVVDLVRTAKPFETYRNPCPRELLAWALMHDATEAYVCDVPRPLKGMLPRYKDAENAVEAAMAGQFKLPWPMPPEVKAADNHALAIEAEFLGWDISDWALPRGPHGVSAVRHHLQEMPPKAVEVAWLAAASDLGLFEFDGGIEK